MSFAYGATHRMFTTLGCTVRMPYALVYAVQLCSLLLLDPSGDFVLCAQLQDTLRLKKCYPRKGGGGGVL